MTSELSKDKPTSRFEKLTMAAILIGVASWSLYSSFHKTEFDLFNESVSNYTAKPTEENFTSLQSAYSICRNDESEVLFSVDCTDKVVYSIRDGDFKPQVIFDALVKNNKLDFVSEMGFFDIDRMFGNEEIYRDFVFNYEGNNYTVNRVKALTLIKYEKYNAAYQVLKKMFISTDDLNYKRDVASIVRGLLKGFNCKNDLIIWEPYSINEVTFSKISVSENTDAPLPLEQVKALRNALDHGNVPELQESCLLKSYKL